MVSGAHSSAERRRERWQRVKEGGRKEGRKEGREGGRQAGREEGAAPLLKSRDPHLAGGEIFTSTVHDLIVISRLPVDSQPSWFLNHPMTNLGYLKCTRMCTPVIIWTTVYQYNW